jgi:quercetin dioxygenase-like cupin family protein
MADNSEATGPWSENVVSLPPNRRYICTHDASGASIVHSSPPQLYRGRPGVGGVARSYATASAPTVLKDDVDVSAYLSTSGPASHKGTDIVVPTGQGANLVVVDIAPGGQSQMHRTVSIDFSICVIGHVCMELDGGQKLELKPGVRFQRALEDGAQEGVVLTVLQDHVIQRGTLHRWYNGSKTEPARFVAVTLPCVPFEIPGTGKMLTEEHLQGTGATQAEASKL